MLIVAQFWNKNLPFCTIMENIFIFRTLKNTTIFQVSLMNTALQHGHAWKDGKEWRR